MTDDRTEFEAARRAGKALHQEQRLARAQTVEDGFGGTWVKCSPTCDLQVVRPGKVQCSCEEPPLVTDMVIPPAAVEELASRLIDGDLSWQPTHVQEQVRRDAVAAIDALLPHLRPLFETATKVSYELGRKEAAGEIRAEIAALPTHTEDGVPIIARDVRHAATQIARRHRMGETP